MDKIETMRAFARVVERRSFARAAQDLTLSRSRVTEAVKLLERQLGVRLLTRTTRHVAPTAEGEDYHLRCVEILAAIDAADAAITSAVPKGPLRVDVPGTFAQHFLLPALPSFLERYPGIHLHIGEGDRPIDLVSEGIDCVIRIGEAKDGGLIGRRLGALDEGTFASPGYLQRWGIPATPDDLDNHRMIGLMSSRTKAIIPFEFQTKTGLKIILLPAAVTVGAAATNVALAVSSLGLIQVPHYRVASEVASGELVEVLAEWPPTPTPVFILHPAGRHISSRARAFIEWATATLLVTLRSG